MKVSLKQLSETVNVHVGESSMSVKIHVLDKAAAAKLYNSIRRYFAKQREIGLFYLIAEIRIFQYCFCQQSY